MTLASLLGFDASPMKLEMFLCQEISIRFLARKQLLPKDVSWACFIVGVVVTPKQHCAFKHM